MATQLETDRGIVRVPTGTWTVDASHSSVEFRVKHMMISTVRGRFDEFEGTIEAAPDYKDSKVRGSIQAASIDTNEPRRDEHLRSADFFDVENNPTIEFASTRIEHGARGDYRVSGDLERGA
jgi:polyisoprenoid-binding protein YceI